MKKIGILALVTPEAGGIYQYTQSIVKTLNEDSHHRFVLFISDKNREDFLYAKNMDIRVIKKRNKVYLRLLRGMSLLLQTPINIGFDKEELKKFSDVDLFLSPYISPYPHYFLDKPFIFTLHDMQENYYPQFFTLKERFVRWLLNRSLSKKALFILCESHYVKKDIEKFLKVPSNKIIVAQAPPPVEFSTADLHSYEKQKEIKLKYNLPDKYFIYPAQFWYHKNHIKLIEAFKLVLDTYNDVYLVLTGYPKNNYYNVVKKIKELNLEKNVIILGYVDYKDLAFIYKMAIALVIPSLFESVSIPIYEAFIIGTPVCFSNVCALPEQVGDAGLVFDPTNPKDIAEKMKLLFQDKQLREKLIKMGYKRVNALPNNFKRTLIYVIEKALNSLEKDIP
ncbi:MAG: glycosyltransferase family 4 protein [Aquificae bacterium]|nr:glycosyltransferase family 4 protein [Aquificota bacterium]